MRWTLAASLACLLLCHAAAGRAEELRWRPAGCAEDPAPAVSLGRPVALDDADASPRKPIFRAQAPALPGPPPPPPPECGVPPVGVPTDPVERYNCGVVMQNPAPSHSIFGSCRRLLGGVPAGVTGAATSLSFRSDPCFNGFISPVTNPFLFEDPRALTEVRPVVIYQNVPDHLFFNKNGTLFASGGDLEFFGLQARVALNQRLSFVIDKLGWTAVQFKDGPDTSGFSEVNLGPKYTFLRNQNTGTLGAVGVIFEVPAGSAKVFQDTGTLSVVPYLTLGQTFGRSTYGSFNALGEVGYAFSVDDKRSEYLFTSLHLDYNIANLNRFYPFVELNWFLYTAGGQSLTSGFEGRDLFNFGSMNIGTSDDQLFIAPGFRFKYNEHLQSGIAAEFPLTGRRDLLEFRITFDLIFRY